MKNVLGIVAWALTECCVLVPDIAFCAAELPATSLSDPSRVGFEKRDSKPTTIFTKQYAFRFCPQIKRGSVILKRLPRVGPPSTI